MDAETAAPGRMSAPERREQLLDATEAIVAREGFHAVSIEAVAREAGVSRPVVYGHFGALSGVLEALVDREAARALAQLEAVLPRDLGTGDPGDMLLAALAGYLEAVSSDPLTWRLVLMPQEGAPKRLQSRIVQGRSAVVAQLARAVGPGLRPGHQSPDPELTARMLSAFADESARLLLTDAVGYPLERLLGHARWVIDQLRPGADEGGRAG